MLGKPVQVDRATFSRSRVSFARICVEIDLSRPIVEEIDINIAGKHVTLKVKWDKIPLYCNECKHVGHSAMTCYASGKRPMPPKRDYSRRPPMHSYPASNSYGAPSEPGESLAASFAAGGQPQAPWRQPIPDQSTTRPPSQVRQQPLSDTCNKENEVRDLTPRSGFYHGSSSTAAGNSQPANDDGFVALKKKKKKNKKKAKPEARREKDQVKFRGKILTSASAARPMSDGEGHRGSDREESSSQYDEGSRSLSHSPRLGPGFGPLAMVLHDINMFGALDDPSSDEDAPDPDDHQDSMVVDASVRRVHFTEPVVQCIEPVRTLPPPEGTPKRARLSASGTV